MHSHSFPAAMGLARQGFFEGVHRLLDVAGGSGCFCIAMAHFHPEIQCSILELPPVCDLANDYIQRYHLRDRIDTLPANMFTDPFPKGYDAVLFANIFHDWTEEQCVHLGTKAFEALPSGGRIFLHEMLLRDSKDGPVSAASFSMAMLKHTKGKQFTAQELESILQRCGFVDVTINHSYGYYSLTTARKP
jgi:cyclopropane fatty-acyl-phospholipid synthase-like methyltransferase